MLPSRQRRRDLHALDLLDFIQRTRAFNPDVSGVALLLVKEKALIKILKWHTSQGLEIILQGKLLKDTGLCQSL